MALAKKCDRCGAYYDVYNIRQSEKEPSGFMFLNIDSQGKYYSNNGHDLCQNCIEELKAWLSGGAENDKH